MKKSGNFYFTLILILMLILMILLSFNYKKGAGIVPLVTGIPTLALLIVGLLTDWKNLKQDTESFKLKSGNILIKKELKSLSILLVLSILIYLFGFIVAVPLFLFILLKIYLSEGWILAIGYNVLISLLLYFFFVFVLRMPIYDGIVFG